MEEADKAWILSLYEGERRAGTIALLWYREGKKLKPDGLEVPRPSDKKKGYGALLAQYAVKAVLESDSLKRQTEIESVFLNLVSPISAGISLKELTQQLNNGADAQNEQARALAETARAHFQGKTKGYDISRFPDFWGRLVHLAKVNDVVFATNIGDISASTAIDATLTTQMLANCANAKIRGTVAGFVMNVTAPMTP